MKSTCLVTLGAFALGCNNPAPPSPDGPAAGSDAGSGAAGPMFVESAELPMMMPATDQRGDPTGGTTTAGGEAVAIFDTNRDGFDDIALVTATPYYEIAINGAASDGTRQFTFLPPTYVGVVGDGKVNSPDGFGLHDFNNDGLLDLYLGNTGRGGISLKDPRPPFDTSATNLDGKNEFRDSGFRTQISNGDGTFSYQELNANADGTTRSAVFADFDGDGRVDMFTSNAPYFGIWWGGSSAPNQLRPGLADGTFGDDVIATAVSNDPGDLWRDGLGRANTDFKGIVVRDFDGDGKPDIILSAFSDIWDGVSRPPLGTADPAGGDVDADGDGVPDGGWQGSWPHGILVLHNTSTPGHISFENVSATAIDNAFGTTDQMHVYVTVPADIDNDGDLDLLVSGPRYFFAANSLQYKTDRVRVYRNDSVPGTIRFTDVTADSGMAGLNDDAQLPALSDGVYPVDLPDATIGGADFVMTPLFSAAAAIDIDNDGAVDWVMIDRQLLAANPATNVEFSAWVFMNDGHGHFSRVPSAMHGLLHTSRELSYADLNHDGRLDLVLANDSGGGQLVGNTNYVYLNQVANANHWIEVEVHLPDNALGIGTKVAVFEAGTSHVLGYDEIRTDFAYRSKRPARVHFGLGAVDHVDVALTLPDGSHELLSSLPVDARQVVQP